MMIDARHCLGDGFRYDGVFKYLPPLGFIPAELVVVAELRKAHGGVKIADLTISKGIDTSEGDVVTTPFILTATPAETLNWPPGALSLTVTVSYQSNRLTSRPVMIRTFPRGE